MKGTVVHLSAKRVGDEWPDTLTADELERLQWRPAPIQEFVLKVHSRCNLACDYCYIYEMADSSWRDQPGAMSLDVALQSARRIREHAERHSLDRVTLVLHGGEPLLIGKDRLARLLEVLTTTLEPATVPVFRIQTNGLLLTDNILRVLDDFDVQIGVSLDGGREANDKHRVRRDGVGTFHVVSQRLNALRRGPFTHLFAGVLATVDVTNDPLDVYEALRAFDPPSLDFLLPHGNWQSRPPAKDPGSSTTPYADWLIAIFDHWLSCATEEPGIRIFDEIIRLAYGKASSFESLGLEPVGLASIQTDGAYELVDTMKSVYDGAAFTGLNVFDDDVDALFAQPSVIAGQLGIDALCGTCRACPVSSICGAGYYPHRYRPGTGFLNPSAYCTDLFKLIRHIERMVK